MGCKVREESTVRVLETQRRHGIRNSRYERFTRSVLSVCQYNLLCQIHIKMWLGSGGGRERQNVEPL